MATWDYNNVTRWIRKSHGWAGLWGAVLGLLFGFRGIWLNHRAVLTLPVTQTRSHVQLALPDPAPANADEMKAWLQTALGIKGEANSTRVNAAKAVAWADKKSASQPPLMQPEQWVFNFGGPNEIIQAEYWRGNRSVGVTTTASGFLATLTNMHKGTGMSTP